MNKILKIFIFTIILLIIIIGTSFYYYNINSKPVSTESDSENIEIEIPKGSSTSKIADTLKANDLIRDENIFIIITKLKGQGETLKSGVYNLNNSMTPEEILNSLIKGGKNSNILKFTIPEGYTIDQIGEKLEEDNIIDKSKFIELTYDIDKFSKKHNFLEEIPKEMNMEGYLFPATYEIYENSSEEDIINKMLGEFSKQYKKITKENNIPSNLNIYEFITHASLVESESKVDKERALVSSVIYNRLKIEMPLQIDATIQYALDNRKEKLSYSDLEIDSIYNTYKNKGLPIGPICSPGIESMQASLNPEETNYIFYVLKKDGSGEHFFTDNYDEFLEVKNKE